MDRKAREQAGARWLSAMRAGGWEAAWRETDAMEADRRAGRCARAEHHLHWDGSAFEGRTVLVRCEHGLGDTLQFLRFVPLLCRQARRLHFMVQPPLVELLRGAPGLGEVHDGWQGPNWPAHDLEIEVMELAYACRPTARTVPAPYPHLARRCAARSFDLPGDDGRARVGLLWASSDWDPTRSVPWPLLQPLLALEHLRFFGLQQGPAASEAEGSPFIEPLWRRTGAIVDAAAAMMRMDLVISIDGMPAHLAATLGRPTWLLLKHEADWRWMDGRSDSPWYPAMRLFRQPGAGDWAGVVDAVVAAALHRRRSGAAEPTAAIQD